MKIILVSLIMILTGMTSTFSQEDSRKFWAIYLLPKTITTKNFSKIDLKKLKPTGEPIIHQNDILRYNQDRHEFLLYLNEAEKLEKLEPKLRNRIFAVFVGDEAVYVGAFWSSLSSQSFAGITINLVPIKKKPNIFAIELGYPTEQFFKRDDLRSDMRILKAFEQVNKLYEDLEVVAKCKSIKPTYKHLPSEIFTFEIISVTKGNFNQKEISAELYYHRSGAKLRDDLRKVGEPFNQETAWNFDENKEIILRFEKQVGVPEPVYDLQNWIIKK